MDGELPRLILLYNIVKLFLSFRRNLLLIESSFLVCSLFILILVNNYINFLISFGDKENNLENIISCMYVSNFYVI